MAMSIRKALGAVKDQTTIGLAKVTSAVSPDLDVAVVRATSHDDSSAPLDGSCRHADQVLRLLAGSPAHHHVAACAASVSRRLARTRDYVVAAKCLALVHRLAGAEGDPRFRVEVIRPTSAPSAGRRAGTEPLPLLAPLAEFRDEAHTASWDHSAFVRAYAAYLDARVRFLVDSSASLHPPPPPPHRVVRFADDPPIPSSLPPPSVHDMDTESVLTRARQLRDLLARLLACRPSGAARTSRVVLAALAPILADGLQLHADVAVALAVLLDRFFEMEYAHCVRAFEAYVGAAKQVDQLLGFCAWCNDLGVVARRGGAAEEFPAEVINRIDDTLLETLEQFLRERGRAAAQNQISSQPPTVLQQRGRVQDDGEFAAAEYDEMSNAVKALPAPERSNATAPTAQKEPAAAAAKIKKPPPADQSEQLVDLRDPTTVDEQGNKLALALFNAPPPPTNNNSDWVVFSDQDDDDNKVTSAWQTPAAEPGKTDWELALVETASALPRQKPALGGGMDPLLLGGMYDQGVVRRHVAAQQAAASGSASSVAAFPGRGSAPMLLALPAPDGTVQTVGGDPFAASLAVPPPSYVQMAEMERKQQLLVQEQIMWAQYRQGGMQGQLAAGGVFASTNSAAPMPYYYGTPAMAYNHVGGYY